MTTRALAFAALLALAACGPKVDAGGGTAAPKKKKHALTPLPADAVLWQGELTTPVDASAILEKEGVLVRTKPPEEGTYWPFSMDYWGIGRTDLEELLAPHVGRRIRVTGHFKKTYDDAVWFYEVDPVKITALADEKEPAK